MPRVQSGLLVSAPGVVGSASVVILVGQGAPSAQTPDLTMDNVRSCALASLFLDSQNGALYLKTGVANAANPNGQWTQK